MPPKKKGNNNRNHRRMAEQGEIELDDDCGQQVALVKSATGSSRFDITLANGDVKNATLRKSVRQRICKEDCVIVEPMSDNLDGQWSIVKKCSPDQRRNLEQRGVFKKYEEVTKKEEVVFAKDNITDTTTEAIIDASAIDAI